MEKIMSKKTEQLENELYELCHNNGDEFVELLVKQMFRATNGRSSDFKKKFREMFFNQHRYLQSEMFEMFYSLCVDIVGKADEKEKWFDGRNEHIIELAKRITN